MELQYTLEGYASQLKNGPRTLIRVAWLKQLALDRDCSIQDLLGETINMLCGCTAHPQRNTFNNLKHPQFLK